jgi:hypothetical protein
MQGTYLVGAHHHASQFVSNRMRQCIDPSLAFWREIFHLVDDFVDGGATRHRRIDGTTSKTEMLEIKFRPRGTPNGLDNGVVPHAPAIEKAGGNEERRR